MFFVTFYSYKGGVGRTMALVNCAAELASRGKKVLIVDFDLEAPGITSFPILFDAKSGCGVVDYICDYMRTSISPSVRDYITECEFPVGDERKSIWVMPAGLTNKLYATQFASIDWLDLYENQGGYLFFEDFKNQIKLLEHGFDYVLIDSRTGYTDIGGICTRQLSDLVVAMFFPNDQNVDGLSLVCSDIRDDIKLDKTKIVFCMSNAPDLDDEDGLLTEIVERSRSKLLFRDLDAVIHHYPSMHLLSQTIFTLARPNTKLAAEYRTLTQRIIRENLSDREGALVALDQIRNVLEKYDASTVGSSVHFSGAFADIEAVGGLHHKDPEIQWKISRLYRTMGDVTSELIHLDRIVASEHVKPRVYLQRARVYMAQARQEDGFEDLLKVVESKNSSALEIISSIQLAKQLNIDRVNILLGRLEFDKITNYFSADEKARLVRELSFTGLHDEYASRILDSLEKTRDIDSLTGPTAMDLMINIIGIGRYRSALRLSIDDKTLLQSSDDIAVVFNTAMAFWGVEGRPDRALISHVVELSEQKKSIDGANFNQCLALCYMILNNSEKFSYHLARARGGHMGSEEFSCWRFRYVPRDKFLLDLQEMEDATKGGYLSPIFLRGSADHQLLTNVERS